MPPPTFVKGLFPFLAAFEHLIDHRFLRTGSVLTCCLTRQPGKDALVLPTISLAAGFHPRWVLKAGRCFGNSSPCLQAPQFLPMGLSGCSATRMGCPGMRYPRIVHLQLPLKVWSCAKGALVGAHFPLVLLPFGV